MTSDEPIPAEAPSEKAISLPEAVHSTETEILNVVASDASLPEDLALTLLKRPELPAETIERLSKNASVMKSRKVKLALVQHARTPRHITLPTVRHLYTFDLMQVALAPTVPADIKRAADEVLISRLESVPTGQRLSLARRASGQIAGNLLLDKDSKVMKVALENSRLTPSNLIRALAKPAASSSLVEAVCHHPKWSVQNEVRITLLRNEKTPLARALEFVHTLPPVQVREILNGSNLAPRIRAYLMKELEQRSVLPRHTLKARG